MDKEELFNEFLNLYPISKLENLKIEEYTNLTKDSFCYWIENKLNDWGNIHGATSYKFGIFQWGKKPELEKTSVLADEKYAWQDRFGKTADEAYLNVRKNIIAIANYAKNEEYGKIDSIDISEMFKWKIAFLYSNKKLINWFSKDALIKFAQYFGYDVNTKTATSELQKILLNEKGDKSLEEFNKVLQPIWDKIQGEGEWLPKDYNPGITVEQWKKLITDKTIFTNNSLITFACIQKAKDTTCTAMAKEFGRTQNFYNNNGWQTGKRVFEALQLTPPKDENNQIWFWSSCCSFRENKEKRWEFKIHQELLDAFEETGILKDLELYADEGDEKMEKLEGYTELLLENKNIILHGAPGTGKTYLAKQIAKKMGCTDDEIGFVQFHPSYDYTDFVEGLRPDCDEKDNVIFTRQDGIFKKFCKKAVNNIKNMNKSENELQQELSTKEILDNFFSQAIAEQREFKTISNISFFVKSYNESHIHIMYKSLDNTYKDVEKIKYSDFVSLYNNHKRIERSDVKTIVNRQVERQADSYSSVLTNIIKLDRIFELIKKWKKENREFELETGSDRKYIYNITDVSYDEIIINTRAWNNAPIEKTQHNFDPFLLLYPELLDTLEKDDYIHYYINDLNQQISKTLDNNINQNTITKTREKQYVFIIDEINRGELSKIFGELFFCIDPGYRGLNGIVKTQYQNLIQDDDEFYEGFYIPENVYIIGTMNDIDRSVESMDFAMRRRFIFEEVTAEESAKNMNLSPDVQERMKRINNQIAETEGLNDSYKIGGAYFLNATDFDKLWRIKLSPLIKEYLRGIDDDGTKYKKIKDSYFDIIDNDYSDDDEHTDD